MGQDKGHDGADDTDVSGESSSKDLPEFLQTEPIPITPPAEPEADSAADASAEDAGAEEADAEEPGAEGADTGDADTEEPGSEEPGTEDADAADEPTAATEQVEVADAVEPLPAFPMPGTEPDPALDMPQPAAEPLPTGGDVTTKAAAKSTRGKKTTLIALATLAVLAVAYIGAAWFFAERVPADTSVAGVDISGLSREEALARLATDLEEVVTSEITVALGEAESAIDPEIAGLAFDAEATVDDLVGFSLDPRVLISHLFGLGAHEPVIRVDGAKTRQALTSIAGDLNVAPVEGELAIVEGQVAEIDPVDGLAIDVEAAVGHLANEWLQGARPVVLPEEVVAPVMDAEAIAAAKARVVDPLFDGDVTLTVNDHTAEIPNDLLVAAASLHQDGQTYELRLDEEILAEAVAELLPELGDSPVDARFTFEGGRPVIVPSVEGAGINRSELAGVVAAAATKSGEGRVASLELETTKPDFTTEDAEALGIKERVSHFTTPVPYDPQRTKNLVNGARKLNGMLIKPGETFSLIEAFGPIDAAHGYVRSGVVVNGFEDTAMGGGLSQVSTTMFNAAFEAGMEDVTHQPHSRHFRRYPEGREATLFLPNLDLKWRNNTPYGVLIQAWIDDETHVALWSTKYWDTRITTGPRTNITQPKTVYNTNPRCVPERGGSPGFTVSYQRIVSKDGVRNDEYSRSYTHTYQPWNHVICGEKPSPQAAAADEDSDDDD